MHVIRLLSRFILLLAITLVAPLVVALIYSETEILRAFFIPIALCLVVAGVCAAVSSRNRARLSARSGFLVVTLCWIVAAIAGSLPFYISGSIPLYVDALFESMSGFTTTGASILSDIEALPRAILFWRSLTHWLGGMGIIALVVALFPLLSGGGNLLLRAELPGLTVDKIAPKIGQTAKILWLVYLGLTVLESTLLLIGGMNAFDAITQTFGTLATGGFSTKNASVGHWQSSFITAVITFFMICAGTNFNLLYRLITGKIGALFRDMEWRLYIIIFLLAAVLIGAAQLRGGDGRPLLSILLHAGFQSAAMLTTTGYVSNDYSLWTNGAQAVLLALMLCGGCAGSTGGGIKIIRILVLARQSASETRYLLHPRAVSRNRMGASSPGRGAIVQAVSGFVALYIGIVFIITIVIAFYGYDILTALSTALATLGNIGPGFGMISPVDNYGFYPPSLKYILMGVMLCGRLEIFTVFILFVPRFWRPRRLK